MASSPRFSQRQLRAMLLRAAAVIGKPLRALGSSTQAGQLTQSVNNVPAHMRFRAGENSAHPVFLGNHTVLALLHGRLLMYLDSRSADVAPHIMMWGAWEPQYTALFQALLRKGDTVLDIGAHLGVYTLLGALGAGPTGQVHAFEPNRRYAQLLRRSTNVNGFSGFTTVHNVAVGAEAGRAELHFSWEMGGGGHLAVRPGGPPEGSESIRCEVVALDQLFPDPAFKVDVIKMDVEGTETFAVRGMTALLQRSPRLRIMFEFAPQMLRGHGSSPAELVQELAALGFRFWTIGTDSHLTPVSAEALSGWTEGVTNILAARGDPYTG